MIKSIAIIHDDLHPLLDKVTERLEVLGCQVEKILWKDIKIDVNNVKGVLSEFDVIYLDRMGELFPSYTTQLLLLIDEINKIPNTCIVNNPKSYLICRDKALMAVKMKEENLPIPNTLIAYTKEQIQKYCDLSTTKKFIAKSYLGCCSNDIFPFKKGEYPTGIDNVLKRDGMIILQEFIFNPDRYIWRIDLVNSKVIQCNQRFAFNADVETPICNGTMGGDIICWNPDDLPQKIYDLAVRTVEKLELNVAGVDILVSEDNQLFIAEVNPEPDITLDHIEFPYKIADYLYSLK